MKIAVDGLPATGRIFAFGLGDAWAVAAATVSLDRPPERFSGSISLKRASQSGVVVVDVVAHAGAPATCDRCNEPCHLQVDVDTRLLFAPANTQGKAFDGIAIDEPTIRDADDVEGIELRADDLDVGWYERGEIVLADVLCEALALEVPIRIVCSDAEACDLRTNALLAPGPTAGGPFAALAGLRPKATDSSGNMSGSAPGNGTASRPSHKRPRGGAEED